jgi:ABC-type oligopeptide transport system substrate-binding subunit/DNA-binding SARP family transcriptional activator
MTRLDIYVLGAFRLVGDQQSVVSLTSRRAQQLLAYLAAERTRPHQRLTLAALCWPEIDDVRARASLRVELHKIRRTLATVGLEAALRTDDATVQLAAEAPIWLDSRAFQTEADAGLFDEGLSPAERIAHLVRAAALYQGEFLDGSYDEWVLAQRDRLGRRYEQVLTQLVRLHLAAGTTEQAIAYARLSLSRNPLDEVMHRALMQALAAAGQRSQALAQYRACAALLAEEFGVEPEAATEQLLAEIEATAERVERPERPPEAPGPLQIPQLPLVGRRDEQDLIAARLAGLQQGRGSFIVLVGDAGIGKTRLLQDARAAGARAGRPVLGAVCYEIERGMLLQPLLDALRRRSDLLTTELARAPLPLRQLLLGLFPELAAAAVGEVSPFPASFDRGDQYQALARLLCDMAVAAGGLLLTVDDLQRADPGTIAVLHYLARQAVQLPLMIVAAVLEPAISTDVRYLLAALAQQAGEICELQPLPAADVAGLIAEHSAVRRLPPTQQQRLAAQLNSVSGGNPFFVLELLRGLVEGGRLTDFAVDREQSEPAGAILPGSLRDAIAQRLRPLAPTTRRLLNQASVIGPHFSWELLSGVSDLDADVLLLGLEELLSRRILRSSDGESYEFAHELVREVVYQSLQPPRRRLLHATVARLRSRADDGSDLPAVELAYHLLRSDTPARAVPYLMRAADRAHRLGGFDQAERQYLQAAEFLDAAGDTLDTAELWTKLALNALAAGRPADARRFQEEAFRSWDERRLLQAPQPGDGGPLQHLRLVSSYAAIGSFDPSYAAGREAWRVIVQLFDGLVRFDPRMHVVPALAERWDVSDDGLRYRFTLRRDARWSDGVPITAHDVVFAWCRVLRLSRVTSLAAMLFDIVGAPQLAADPALPDSTLAARACDDTTLEVELTAPVARFLYVIALPIAFPLPRHAVARYADHWAEPPRLVSSGPYRLADVQQPGRLRLERSATYNGPSPGNIGSVEIVIEPDSTRRLQLFVSGAVDIAAELSGHEQRWARRNRPNDLVVRPALSTTFTAYNWRVSPFDRPAVRRALALAVDRDAWARQLEGPGAVGAHGGFVPPGIAGHSSPLAPAFDPELARHLLARSGLRPALTATLPPLLATSAGFQEGARYVADQWRSNLGITVDLRVGEVGTIIQDWLAGRIALLHLARSANYPDPDNWLRYAVRGLQAVPPGDTLLLQTLAAAASAVDENERLEQYRLLDRLLVSDRMLVTPLTYEPFAWLVHPWLRGYHFGAFSHWTPFQTLTIVDRPPAPEGR